jgi:uridine phosphorylase
MRNKPFQPFHLNATAEDFAGNNGIGRYVILPGCDGRAKEVADHFKNVKSKEHPRGHHLYTGTLTVDRKKIDVATLATGMGCPSVEIILHELFHLGAKRFLRVGTAGSLQPWVHVGDLINAQASVRDEDTTSHYAPIEIPAIASLELTSSILLTAEKIGLSEHLHTGIVHCKSSLYAREFGEGPRAIENKAYLEILKQNGVLASEMETAALFIQSQIYNHQLMEQGLSTQHKVLAGAILGIISAKNGFNYEDNAHIAMKNAILLAIESVKTLAIQELFN